MCLILLIFTYECAFTDRPTKAVMTVDPDQTSYKPNTALIMTCTGSIGIQVPEQVSLL